MKKPNDGLDCVRGVMFALPISLFMWALLIWGVIACVKGCHKKPEYESVGPLPTNVMIKAEVIEIGR